MAKPVEERFPGFQNVYFFEMHLKQQKANLKRKIEEGEVKDQQKAKKFLQLLESVLRLPYFNMNINVHTLMSFLKEDTRQMDESIKRYEKAKEDAAKRVKAITEAALEDDSDYAIPDEWYEQQEAKQKSINEARQEIYGITAKIESIKNEKKVLQNLKGMICRPKGFFANL
ncbi:MAG: hypothetical protein IKK43_05965 [Clostridia bacterium]|nr:hypothetical protein [Clostridia bacterium]